MELVEHLGRINNRYIKKKKQANKNENTFLQENQVFQAKIYYHYVLFVLVL